MPHEDLAAVLLHQRSNRLVDLLLEEDRVVAFVPPDQFRLDLISEVRSSQEPLAGAAGPVVDLADLGPHPGLVNEFDGGQEIIQEGAQGTVDSGEGLEFSGGVEPAAADILPDALEVFLLDETVVVFLVGPGTGLGLVIARNLCRLMVGDITVKSVYGQGSVFTATVLQLIRGMVPCALVERPETKNVLVYETRPVYARSLTYTIDNLGVGCALVHNENDFLERLDSVDWQFVITSSALCDEVETILKERHAKARLVLFTAFGETSRPGTTSLPAPALPWTVADILNGETGAALSPETQKTAPRCTAPEARILIVDDIATNLEVASGLLAPWQMTIDRALGGLEAINLVEKNHVSGGKGYDLILMDHMMPGMDGVETTARIRAWEQETAQSPVPVIALTANAVSGMKEMFLEKGFSDFISKPIDPAKLEEKIAQWLPARKKVKGKGAGEIESGTLKMEGKEEGGILIPGVDTAKGIAMTGGTAAGCKKVLSLFRKDARERLALLQDPPEPEALPVFVTQVHALKSASATIGAAEVSAEAAAMEAAGKGALAGNATDTAAIREKLPGFYRRLSALIEAIAKEEELTTKAQSNLRFAAQKEDTEKGRDNAAYGEHLALLKSALEAKDMKEIDRLLEEIEKMSLDAETREGIDVVSDKVLMGEYAGALETANTLFDNTAGKGTV